MAEDKTRPITCSECDSIPQLYETPYRDSDYVVMCECESTGIDVSDSVNGNALFEPLSGNWSNLEYKHQHR